MGHRFAILMAHVGTLRPIGLRRRLTWALGNSHMYEYAYIESLAVRIDVDEDRPIESISEYVARLQKTWPKFPPAVIEQWFYEHRQAIHQNDWLPYEKLSFQLLKIPTEQLINECLSLSEMAKHNERHTQLGTDSPRLNRLTAYFREHGTWPKPPIALSNDSGAANAPWGQCDRPLHLLEGFHRAGVLLAHRGAPSLQPCHPIWVATIENSSKNVA